MARGLAPIEADPDQIQQVLVNLVNNAVQALANQKRLQVIRLKTDQVNGTVRLWVEDNGPGVPKDLEAKIFEPFFTTKEVGQGTGLGLSIAHSIMSEHSGQLSYQSSELGGACFVLEFPVSQKQPEAPAPPVTLAETPFFAMRKVPITSARILVLDDETILAEMLGQIIGLLGHQVTLSFSPLDALKQIEAHDYDLIFSDYRMPVLDGQQFYQRVAKLKPALAARIIFLTGDVVNEETQGFLASVGNAHIMKPFQIAVIQTAIDQAMECSRN